MFVCVWRAKRFFSFALSPALKMIHTNKQAGISSEGGHYALFYFRGERDPHVVSRPGLPERLNVFRFLTHVV